MKTYPFSRALLFAVAALVSVTANGNPVHAAEASRVREPAVAGLFYPKDPAELTRTIDACLATAKTDSSGNLKALIVPHAGYAYSGPVAASGYRLLVGRAYQTVVVMGPSHYAFLSAASVSGADKYRTPLGDVAISSKAKALGKLKPFAIDADATVQRPDWWRHSSRSAPSSGEENAETWEHSVEVEIPFLQKTLSGFALVPVVVGEVDTAKAARALEQVLDDQTLIIASSDLSHYHPYADAQKRDRSCIDTILKLDTATMPTKEACGVYPISILLQVAKDRGWKPQLLDLRNSGDISGDKNSVVGYCAIAFFAASSPSGNAATAGAVLTPEDGQLLLKWARDSVSSAASHRAPPTVDSDSVSAELKALKSSFVTLNERGDLRGCIGHLGAREPLYQDVIENARSAALEDPRFSPVTSNELNLVEIEVSVLTNPEPLAFDSPDDLVKKLQPHRDGVVLTIGQKGATYLPQVWEQIHDKIEFLNTLAEKAGCAPTAWRGRNVSVSIYHVVSFSEAKPAK